MKKLNVVLTFAFGFSIHVMNATPEVSSYDDCDHALSSPDPGLKAPTNSPQVGPVDDQQVPGDSLAALLFLHETGEGVLNREASNDEPKTSKGTQDVDSPDGVEEEVLEGSCSTIPTAKPANALSEAPAPELQLYYYEQDGDEFSLKRLTEEDLYADYDSLLPGQTYVATFKPNIHLAIKGEVTTPSTPVSFWDTFPLIAKIRAWTKWWLNPYAWRNSSYYSLNYQESQIDWDPRNTSATITTNLTKDKRYLLSQLGMYLYVQWGSKYMNPYIAPETRWVFDSVLKLRFNRVEKAAFERVGFQNVRIETRINPLSKHVEYCVVAEK